MTAALLPITSLPPARRQRRRRLLSTPVRLAGLAAALVLLYTAEHQVCCSVLPPLQGVLARSPVNCECCCHLDAAWCWTLKIGAANSMDTLCSPMRLQAAELLAYRSSRVLPPPVPPPPRELPGPSPKQLARWREYAAARCVPCLIVPHLSVCSAPYGTCAGLIAQHSRQLNCPLLALRTCRNCSLADADYAPIFEQLAPFRTSGGVTPAVITRTLDALDPRRYYGNIVLLELRNGTAHVTKGNADQNIELLFSMLPGFAKELPDMDLVVNLFDEPAVWTAPLPPEVDGAVRTGVLYVGDAFARHGCDGVSGPGGAALAAARAQRLHGTFARSSYMGPFARGPLPVFSWSTIPGCFGGALLPGAGLAPLLGSRAAAGAPLPAFAPHLGLSNHWGLPAAGRPFAVVYSYARVLFHIVQTSCSPSSLSTIPLHWRGCYTRMLAPLATCRGSKRHGLSIWGMGPCWRLL